MNKDILLKDDKNNNLFPLAHKDSDQNIIKDTYAPLNMPSFTGGIGVGTSAVSNEIKSTMPLHINGGDGLDLYYNSYGIYKDSIATENRILQLGNQRQDLLLEAPSRKIFLGYQRTQSVGIYAPIDTNVSFSKNISVAGTSEFTGGIYSLSTGQVNTATSANGMLLIKRASITDDSTPNNGVVLEYGNSTSWKGQLYIGDNADQGVYVNGWSDGTRGTWKKLMFQNDLTSLLEPIRVSNTSTNKGVGIGVDPQNNKVISNKEIDVVNSSGTVQSAMYTNGDIHAKQDSIIDRYSVASKGYLSYRATYSGGNTAGGCVRFATIKITSTNTNGPLTILISPRGMSPTLLTVRFNNSGVDPVLDDCMTRGGNVICGIRKTAASTWDLYCQNGGTYQNILFQVVTPTMLYQEATLTWDNTVSTSWPSDIVYAIRGTITPMGTGNVNTANGSLNGQLVIKSANVDADGTPNNGVVLEFGNSTTWKGQLFFADNGSEGVWTGGWYNGTHQPWRRLFEATDYRTQNTFTTSGVTYYNSRATLSAGGYFTSGKMVFIAFSLKINATMGAPDYWLMIQGLPKPRFLTALSCAGINKKGTYGAWINGNGEINIQTSSTSLTSGDYIAITGFYFIA